MSSKEAAKFLSGFETFHAIVHVYLLLSGTTMTLFGITTTPALSTFSVLLNGAIALLLGWYGWRSQTTSRKSAVG